MHASKSFIALILSALIVALALSPGALYSYPQGGDQVILEYDFVTRGEITSGFRHAASSFLGDFESKGFNVSWKDYAGYNFYFKFLNDTPDKMSGEILTPLCDVLSRNVSLWIMMEKPHKSLSSVSLRLVFSNGLARCRENYSVSVKPLKITRSGSLTYLSFEKLVVNAGVLVNNTSGEALGFSGAGYGEWVFTLREGELRAPLIPLLYSIDPWLEMTGYVNGSLPVALLALINTSLPGSTDYYVRGLGISIPGGQQVQSSPYTLGFITEIYVANGSANYDVLKARCSNYRLLCMDYGNGTFVVHPDTVWRSAESSLHKPWSYISRLNVIEGSMPQYIGRGKEIQVVHGVKYHGRTYVAMTFSSLGGKLTYDARSGVLLKLSAGYSFFEAGRLMIYILPSELTYPFRIAPSTMSSRPYVSLELVNTNVELGHGFLGGIAGKPSMRNIYCLTLILTGVTLAAAWRLGEAGSE